MRMVPLVIAAMMTFFPAYAQAQQQESCKLLEGKSSDWSVVYDNGSTVIVKSVNGGLVTTSYRCYRFTGEGYNIVAGRFVPNFNTGSAPVDTASVYTKGWNEALDATATLRR